MSERRACFWNVIRLFCLSVQTHFHLDNLKRTCDFSLIGKTYVKSAVLYKTKPRVVVFFPMGFTGIREKSKKTDGSFNVFQVTFDLSSCVRFIIHGGKKGFKSVLKLI